MIFFRSSLNNKCIDLMQCDIKIDLFKSLNQNLEHIINKQTPYFTKLCLVMQTTTAVICPHFHIVKYYSKYMCIVVL